MSIAARGAPGSLVRVVGAGSRGNSESEKDAEDAVHWVFSTYINMDYLMNQLKRGRWKLYLRPGHDRSDGVTDDMIVYCGVNVAVVVEEDDDDGDLKPSALPPPAPHTRPRRRRTTSNRLPRQPPALTVVMRVMKTFLHSLPNLCHPVEWCRVSKRCV